MSNLLSYQNYNGTVEYSKEDGCLFGKVIGIKSLLSYEGNSVKELEQDFQEVIDAYLNDCKERNIEPEQPYTFIYGLVLNFIGILQCMRWSMEKH